jgi:group I intron endonuclease
VASSLESMAGIYAISNLRNGHFYVGSARSIGRRARQHRHELARGKHPNVHLQRSWNKYGPDAFRWEPVAVLEVADLHATEQRLLDALVGRPDCYNICPTPTAGMAGRRHTAESRAKMAASQRGKKQSPETVAKRNAVNTGRKMSPESLAKRALTFAGKDWSEATAKRRRAWADMESRGDPKMDRIKAGRFQKGHPYLGRRGAV